MVINCDQPWNPARLEQRVARAWRKEQTHAVTVLNLISERTIEHRLLAALANKQALSDGVLDQRGDLSAIKLMGGRENFLQRLETLFPDVIAEKNTTRPEKIVRPPSNASFRPAWTPPGQGTCPAHFVCGRRNCSTARLFPVRNAFPHGASRRYCWSWWIRMPSAGRPNYGHWRRSFFGQAASSGEPAPAVSVEVVDRATAELLRRLAESGVVSPSLRASRVLYPPDHGRAAAISASEQNRASFAREQHARRLKMARILAGEEMTEEARAAVVAAIHEMGRALAIEHRQSEPANALGAVAPPLDSLWPGGEPVLIPLRTFLADERAPLLPVISALGQPVETEARQARDYFAGIKAKLATMGN